MFFPAVYVDPDHGPLLELTGPQAPIIRYFMKRMGGIYDCSLCVRDTADDTVYSTFFADVEAESPVESSSLSSSSLQSFDVVNTMNQSIDQTIGFFVQISRFR